MNGKLIRNCTILILILSLCAAISLFVGAERFSLERITKAFSKGTIESVIVFKLRLPRILLCMICGALLGGSGAVLQGFFRNPLADTGILGISSGATLGAVLSGFFTLTTLKFLSPISLFAFAGGLASGVLIFVLSFLFRNNSTTGLLLAGTSVATFISALCSLLLLMKQKDLHTIFVWTMGSFNAKGWKDFDFLIFPSIISLCTLLICAPFLDVLGSGEKTAISLGLNLRFTKIFILISTSLAASCAVCAGGVISFVGLIAPHIVRTINSSRHRSLVPLSMLTGAIILLIADTISRTIAPPTEIPIGIITALFGVPFFILILRKNANA